MDNKCYRCGGNAGKYDVICYECEKKKKRKEAVVITIVAVLSIGFLVGVRLLWAKVVYKDMRCAWAECRIITNP